MHPIRPDGQSPLLRYKLWSRLRRYAEAGRYHIDNNPVERGQRPTVLGRKNYLFSKSDNGAVDNAIFYSLIESCDILGIEPLQWLTRAKHSAQRHARRRNKKHAPILLQKISRTITRDFF